MLFVRRVVGQSMQPTYQPGDIVVALRWCRPHIGDIVVAIWRGREIVKRIADISSKGFFLVGDNAAQSSDSRVYGWFAPKHIKGVVIRSFGR